MKNIYLDHIASMPVYPEVIDAMLPYLREHFGNPQSRHSFGDEPKRAIENARSQVAELIGAHPEEIYFTSSGTESNNLALKGIATAHSRKGRHIIISSIEHHSVLHSARSLQKQGYEITHLPVDRNGLVSSDDLASAIRDDTILISIMHANNEIGTIEPIEEIGTIARERGVYLHTDAVATVGIIPVDVEKLKVDMLTFSSQQIHGQKGVAALYIKKGVRVAPILDGGIQENGRRPGTENVPGIVGMGKAAEITIKELHGRMERMTLLRDRLIRGLEENIDYLHITGDRKKRLPNIVSLCVEFIEGESMTLLLSAKGIAAASGSTCSSHALKASHVILAIGIPPAVAQGSILFSLGKDTAEDEIEYLIEVFPPIIKRLREMSPLYEDVIKKEKGKL
ncbi:MAG: cysteine desulfurase family protein [Nitrospirota bacterium]